MNSILSGCPLEYLNNDQERKRSFSEITDLVKPRKGHYCVASYSNYVHNRRFEMLHIRTYMHVAQNIIFTNCLVVTSIEGT